MHDNIMLDMSSKIKMNLYYDETNNIRKFYLTDKKREYLNQDVSVFILGGIGIPQDALSQNNNFNENLKTLFQKLKLNKTQNELKFKHIGSSDFRNILKSERINIIFNFLLENNIVLHMHVVDMLHWSLVDVLESETAIDIANPYFFIDPYIFNKAKSVLTEIAKAFKTDFIKELYEFEYPDVIDRKDKFADFLKKYLSNFIENKTYTKNGIELYVLHLFGQIIEKINELDNDMFCFLEDEPKYELIKKFDAFYFYNIKFFPESHHIFDREVVVEKSLKPHIAKMSNYEFVDSKDNLLIQLSDVIVGFFRIFFEYIMQLDYIDIEQRFNDFTAEERLCLKKFFNICKKAEEVDMRLFNYVASCFDLNKIFLLSKLSLKTTDHQL